MDVVCCICHLILSIYDRNFLSTYSDRKSCHTSTTLQTSIARFVSDSWASCDRNCHFIFSLVLIWCLLGDCYLVRLYCYNCLLYFAVWQQSVLFVCLLACSFLSIKSTIPVYTSRLTTVSNLDIDIIYPTVNGINFVSQLSLMLTVTGDCEDCTDSWSVVFFSAVNIRDAGSRTAMLLTYIRRMNSVWILLYTVVQKCHPFYFTVVSTDVDRFLYVADSIPNKCATQQLLIYPPHLRNAATLPWQKVNCIVLTLATKVTHYRSTK